MELIEIDGPQISYVYIENFPRGDSHVELRYATVCFYGKTEEAVKVEGERQQKIIRDWLSSQEKCWPILWWRQRPGTEKVDQDAWGDYIKAFHGWGFYMRFATTPTLPKKIWNELIIKAEGADPIVLKEKASA